MKITGYKKEDTELEGCMVLSDFGIMASSQTLRELATFLNSAADEMDEWSNWKEGFPDIQVLSTQYI